MFDRSNVFVVFLEKHLPRCCCDDSYDDATTELPLHSVITIFFMKRRINLHYEISCVGVLLFSLLVHHQMRLLHVPGS